MAQYLIKVSPRNDVSISKEYDLDYYQDKSDLFQDTDVAFPNTIPIISCPICSSTMKQDDDGDFVCPDDNCKGLELSGDVERSMVYHVDQDDYYSNLLGRYGYVLENKINEDFRDFIDEFEKVNNTEKESAFIVYLDNMHFSASKYDISDIMTEFENNYIGYSGSIHDDRTREWYGQYMVENGMVEVPSHLEDSIDYGKIANDAFCGGDVWCSEGYVFYNS